MPLSPDELRDPKVHATYYDHGRDVTLYKDGMKVTNESHA